MVKRGTLNGEPIIIFEQLPEAIIWIPEADLHKKVKDLKLRNVKPQDENRTLIEHVRLNAKAYPPHWKEGLKKLGFEL